jgi:hypothetical protein
MHTRHLAHAVAGYSTPFTCLEHQDITMCDALHISDLWGYDAIRWHVARRTQVLLAWLSLPALDEFDNVAIGIFHHGNGGPGPDGGFGPREGNVVGCQPLDHLVQIGDDKG